MRFVVLLAVIAIAAACSPGSDGGGSTRQFTDESGWSIAYPDWMHVEESGAEMRVSVWQTTFASFRPRRSVRRWSKENSGGFNVDPPLTSAGDFPPDAVALRVMGMHGGPYHGPSDVGGALSDFSLENLAPLPDGTDASGVQPIAERFVWRGSSWDVRVWIGPEATEERRAAIAEMVASLEFSPPDG